MNRKTLIIILTLFSALAAFLLLSGSQPVDTGPLPAAATNTTEGIRLLPTVEAETQALILQSLRKAIPPDQPYSQHSGEKSLAVHALVSTGITQTVSIALDEQIIHIDFLWAYDRTNRGLVTRLPVAFGLAYPDGRYEYFSDTLFYTRQYEGLDLHISRTEALQDLKLRMPRGRIFSLTFYQSVTPEKVVWKECPEALQAREMSEGACVLGERMDLQYPGALRAFIQRSENSIPQGWLLVGWFFAEADETFVQRDVILSEE